MEKKSDKSKFAKAVIIGIPVYVVFLIVLTALFLLSRREIKNSTRNLNLDPELARAMTYDQFEDGDENIEGTDNVKFSAFYLRDLDGDGYAEKIKRNM